VLGPRGQYIHDNRVVILTITVINYSSLLGILECDDGGCDEMMILGSSTLCIQLSIVLPFCYALTCGQNCRIYFTARCEGFDFFLCVYVHYKLWPEGRVMAAIFGYFHSNHSESYDCN
jgi:hypothetical protein